MYKFHDGQTVALMKDYPELGLKAGDTGIVWTMYSLDPPAYEVTMQCSNGEKLDVTVTEDELAAEESSLKATPSASKDRVKAAL